MIMSKPVFKKHKTEFVLKSNGQSLEFPTYRDALTYKNRFLKLFPDLEIIMFKVVIYLPENQLNSDQK